MEGRGGSWGARVSEFFLKNPYLKKIENHFFFFFFFFWGGGDCFIFTKIPNVIFFVCARGGGGGGARVSELFLLSIHI